MCHSLVKKSLWRATVLYGYAFVGGCIFYIIERKPESSQERYSRLAHELQQSFTTKFNVSINESDFKIFIQKAFDVVTAGNQVDWDIISGLSFAMTSLTTIGYGHITPETSLGQIITVVYCLIGLPIAMLTLKTLGELISKIVHRIVCLVETRLLGRRRPRKLKIKTFCFTFMLMILTLCFGGLTQMHLEGWSFVEGIYSWFATLSTIGYGDYIPGLNVMIETLGNSDSRTKISVWLIIYASALPGLAGLCVVSGVLNSLVEALEELRIQSNVCNKKKSMKLKRNRENATRLKYSKDLSQSDNKVILTAIRKRTRSASV